MQAEEFVYRLAQVAPNVADLKSLGLTTAQANKFRDHYVCRERQTEVRDPNPLFALFEGWDLTRIQIGMVSFLPAPEVIPEKIHVGSAEADPLYVMKATGELLSEELHVPGYVLWTVARDGSMFLDALIPAAKFLSKRCVGAIDLEDFPAARQVAEQCAVLAGGDRYLQFYSVMLGAD